MNPISDKELDKLFQQRFEHAEIEPSALVWGKISGKMDRQKRKSLFPVFWMAAASVIVIVGAGLWYYKPVEVIRLQGDSQVALNHPDQNHSSEVQEKNNSFTVQQDKSEFSIDKSVGVNSQNFKVTKKEPVEQQANIKINPEAGIASNIPVRKVVPASLPKQEVQIPTRYTGDQSKLDVTQPDMIAKAEFSQQDVESEEPVSREPKRIKSIGSVLNFVISKVDKRNDKIIEYKDGEEGSEISGINLGVFKLKSKK